VQINEIASRTYPTSALFEPDQWQYSLPILLSMIIQMLYIV